MDPKEGVMPFCPTCKYEYTDGKVECVDCGAMLVDELPVQDHEELISGDTNFVPFRTYPSHVHAEMIREVLANEGVTAVIKGSELHGAGTGATALTHGVVIWIPDDEQEDAARIADSILDPI
jgi:hypothetical protein